MPAYITHNNDKKVYIESKKIDTVLSMQDGDVALLFLLLQRETGVLTASEICSRMKWTESRLETAENKLKDNNLLGEKQNNTEQEEEFRYPQEGLSTLMERDGSFSQLIREVEGKMGKSLSVRELQMMASLYDDLQVPIDVIYILICHCIEKTEKAKGYGARPSMRQIQKEASYWIKKGITNQSAADQYLREYAKVEEKSTEYLREVGIAGRAPVSAEETYIRNWIEMGFPCEVVRLAYEKTILRKGEMNWNYLNAILKNWHEAGAHTLEEIQEKEKKLQKNNSKNGNSGNTEPDISWMKEYLK